MVGNYPLLSTVAIPLYMPKSLHSFIPSLVYIEFESLLVVDVIIVVVSQTCYNCVSLHLSKFTSPIFLPMQWSIYFCMIAIEYMNHASSLKMSLRHE